MCGIAGIIGARSDVAYSAVTRMVDALRHRGPDDSGQVVLDAGGGILGLGHTRLSIIDLSDAGHQPMVHPGTGDVLVYNGEIYNFRELRGKLESEGCTFIGSSDSEVLLQGLALHGADFVSCLEGMYAFAFLVKGSGDVILARDPLGIKPLYVGKGRDGTLLFASEVRAMVKSGQCCADMSTRAVASYLAYGAVQGPDTILENVSEFPAGCYQIVSIAKPVAFPDREAVRYWRFPVADQELAGRDVIEKVKSTLDRSVKTHLISDVPVGVFLSSGLDSTIVASLAVKHAPDIRTFTVAMSEADELDESVLAEETARKLGAKHETIHVSMADAERLAISWFADMDQPTMDGLNTYVISRAVRGAGVTVTLSGQGGDELFGGYPAFGKVPLARRIVGAASWLPRELRAVLSSLLAIGRPVVFREKARDLLMSDGSTPALYSSVRRMLTDRQMAGLGMSAGKLGLTPLYVPESQLRDLGQYGKDSTELVSILESRFYLGNMLLRDGDVFGMAHPLEIRVPMLDRRMLDLVYSIPGPVRRPSGMPDKYLLREAFGDYIRPELADQKKKGFTLPIALWMRGTLRDMCESGLQELKRHGDFVPSGVDRIWDIFLNDKSGHEWTRAWTLAVLGIYLAKFRSVTGEQ